MGMTDRQMSKTSPARETLRELIAGRTVARGEREFDAAELPEGAEIPPGSMVFPPCKCPRCR